MSEFDPKEFIASLPRRPGVYRMFGAGHELLYVGKARSLRDRVGTYFAPRNVDPKVRSLTAQIEGVEVTVTDRKSTRLNSSHEWISYAVFCLKKKKKITNKKPN